MLKAETAFTGGLVTHASNNMKKLNNRTKYYYKFDDKYIFVKFTSSQEASFVTTAVCGAVIHWKDAVHKL